MRTLSIVLFAAVCSLAACKKKETTGAGSGTATATGSGTATASGSGSASASGSGSGSATGSDTAGSGSATGSGAASGADLAGANRAGNCPSAVAGATTAIVDDKDTAGKLVLSITAKDADGSATIRRRVAHLVEVQGAPDAEVKHTGDGTGGAASGKCPVVTSKETKITASDIEGGSKVVIEASGALTADALKADVEKRITALSEWTSANIKPTDASGGGGGVGGGKGDHGGNHSGDGDGKGKDKPKPQ
ncbi:MAG TPA: hypothetical protein VM261_27575 [Kofleriaceae bacterium]|nr:hypothetical protein [Kofleriaceae bacterium]